MIKADKIATRIEGSNLEVAIQFMHLMDVMIERHPEMVTAYIHARCEEIEKAIKTANADEIMFSEFVYETVSQVEGVLNNEK